MSEEKKILEMIQEGTITAEEGMELLNALKSTKPLEENKISLEKESNVNSKKELKFLRIKVETEKDVKVNVNIPLKLIKVVGGFVPQISNFIPNDAKDKIEKNGVNLANFDINGIIELIEAGELEDNTLIDVTANDEKEGLVKVKVYVE